MSHKKIAVLIDSENTPHSKLRLILNELSRYGQIIVKRAYGDFSTEHLKNWKASLNELAIQPQQQFSYTTGKNSTDALMIIDAMDLLYSQRFDTFALVSSDSDFTSLATRLREAEMFVIGLGKTATPVAFKNACDDFIALENMEDETDASQNDSAKNEKQDKDRELWRLMHQSWQTYRDEQGWAGLGEVGSYLKRLKPDFDPRNYGFNKLSDFFEAYPNRYQVKRIQSKGLSFRFITKAKTKEA